MKHFCSLSKIQCRKEGHNARNERQIFWKFERNFPRIASTNVEPIIIKQHRKKLNGKFYTLIPHIFKIKEVGGFKRLKMGKKMASSTDLGKFEHSQNERYVINHNGRLRILCLSSYFMDISRMHHIMWLRFCCGRKSLQASKYCSKLGKTTHCKFSGKQE
jgi:hypothetical protein